MSELRKRPFAERLVEVIDERPTGEVLLDEALKLMKLETQSVGNWIDLMSGTSCPDWQAPRVAQRPSAEP